MRPKTVAGCDSCTASARTSAVQTVIFSARHFLEISGSKLTKGSGLKSPAQVSATTKLAGQTGSTASWEWRTDSFSWRTVDLFRVIPSTVRNLRVQQLEHTRPICRWKLRRLLENENKPDRSWICLLCAFIDCRC